MNQESPLIEKGIIAAAELWCGRCISRENGRVSDIVVTDALFGFKYLKSLNQ